MHSSACCFKKQFRLIVQTRRVVAHIRVLKRIHQLKTYLGIKTYLWTSTLRSLRSTIYFYLSTHSQHSLMRGPWDAKSGQQHNNTNFTYLNRHWVLFSQSALYSSNTPRSPVRLVLWSSQSFIATTMWLQLAPKDLLPALSFIWGPSDHRALVPPLRHPLHPTAKQLDDISGTFPQLCFVKSNAHSLAIKLINRRNLLIFWLVSCKYLLKCPILRSSEEFNRRVQCINNSLNVLPFISANIFMHKN